MLSTNVKTASDLMSIALQAEREAIRRYTDLSHKMQDANNEAAAALFIRLIAEEQEHERLLLQWMSKENIVENPDIGPVKWRDPNISTTYDNDARDPSYSSPYRALAFAVHNEEIAFRFYTHVAANSDKKDIREYAETLAREELGHAALLRAERRRAYHAERNSHATEPVLSASNILTMTDLLSVSIHLDEYLLKKLDRLDLTSAIANTLKQQFILDIKQNKQALTDNIQQQHDSPDAQIISTLQQLDLFNDQILHRQTSDTHVLQRLLEMFDHEFSFYDSIVENTENEDLMLAAQRLSSDTLDRTDLLKQLLTSLNLTAE